VNDEHLLDEHLAAWLASSGPHGLSPRVVDDALARARRMSQRGSVASAITGPTPWPPSRNIVRRAIASPGYRFVATVALVVAVALVVVDLAPPSALMPGSSPSSVASPEPAPTAVAATPAPPRSGPTPVAPNDLGRLPTSALTAVETLGPARTSAPARGFDVPGGVALTSAAFGLPIRFLARPWHVDVTPPDSDWCWAATSARAVVIPYRAGCADELRVLWPSAVECGPGSGTLTVDAFVQAVLHRPGLTARDAGPLGDNAWARIVTAPATGRVIVWAGGEDASAFDNPDDCRIRSGDVVDELRHDLWTALVVLDLEGQLVLVRWSPGHDRQSAIDARARGYTRQEIAIPEGYLQLRLGG
jgi:hypothetical protein